VTREPNRLREPGDDATIWYVLLGVIAAAGVAVAAVMAWQRVGPLGRAGLIGALAVLAAVVAAVAAALRRLAAASTWVDDRGKYMNQTKDFNELTEAGAARGAARLGAEQAGPGVPLGTHVPGRMRLYATWEWVQVWILGPRAGKTTCVCVPQMLKTSGPVLFTTNKTDGIPETKGPRSRLGKVWIHDVQQIVGEPVTWWWNPLTFVTDIARAEKLADVFIAAATSASDRQDAYFTSTGKETLSRLLLAAALDGRPITDVFRWANDEENRDGADSDPARVLAAHGEIELAQALYKTQTLNPRQRDGVYGTLRPWIAVLGSRAVRDWITQGSGQRPHFDPAAFVRSADTLYLVSKEGGGTARALTAALTVAVLTAAEEHAAAQPNGRLPVPLTAVLDEVANVCRWKELPDVYSHYGSRGIVLSAFFQSWAQGVEAFGQNGMDKLWSAANVRVAGSGLAQSTFLRAVSDAIGSRDVRRHSRSTGGTKGGTNRQESIGERRIFDVAELTGLPRGRAVAFIAGTRSVLLRLDHYSTRPYAGDVEDSKKWFAQTKRERAVEAGAGGVMHR
jgi:type IV secretory pathway TraG/TraD family ATPase VirD4